MHRHHPEYDAGPRRDPVLHDWPPQFDAAAEVHLVGHQIRAIGQERQPPQPPVEASTRLRCTHQQAAAMSAAAGHRRGHGHSLIRLGDAYSAAGQHSSARESWAQALELLGNIRPPDADRISVALRTGQPGSSAEST